MPSKKPHQVPLGEKLTLELLSLSYHPLPTLEEVEKDPETGTPRSLGERLQWAVEHLKSVVQETRKFLHESEVARHMAVALATHQKKRGKPKISVTDKGEVVLVISYGERSYTGIRRGPYSKKLPKLEELRAEAKRRGLDITHLGRQRKAIQKLLLSSDPEDDTPSPMAAEPDEVKVSAAPPRTPKRFRPTITPPKPSPELQKLLEVGEDVDVDSLLK